MMLAIFISSAIFSIRLSDHSPPWALVLDHGPVLSLPDVILVSSPRSPLHNNSTQAGWELLYSLRQVV